MRVSPITQQYYKNKVSSVRPVVQPLARDYVSFNAGLPRVPLKDKLKNSIFSLDMQVSSWFNFYAARKANNLLDNMYGKDNYTVMVVGRSMASVGETMKLLGSDVKILPLSGLTRDLEYDIKHVDVYREYLKSIGLTKDIIAQNPEHKFLLVDYACTGSSLRNAKTFLTRPELLGNSKRIKTMNSDELAGSNKLMAGVLNQLYFINYFKAFAPVSSLDIEELDKVFERSKPDVYFKKVRDSFLEHVMRRVENYRKKTGKD